MKVDIENGKYTYVSHDSGAELLRHGEFWQDVTGQKVWYCAAYELQEAREERDALAAQLNRNTDKLIGDLLQEGLEPDNIPASLARLKAQWQAEALDKLADEGCWSSEAIRWEADELRRQAEGGED